MISSIQAVDGPSRRNQAAAAAAAAGAPPGLSAQPASLLH